MESHVTVLKEVAVEALALKDSSRIVDATLGSGGHAALILSRLGKEGVLIALDLDETAIEAARGSLTGMANVNLVRENFRNIDRVLKGQKVDGILADLGWRMEQFSGNGKGFSFRVDEELLMTLGDPKDYPFTARDIVNDWKEEDIANVLKGYGEERYAKRIAKRIVEVRVKHPIMTTFDLVHIIETSVPSAYQRGRIHAATRTFQALRIAVNDELDALRDFIHKAVKALDTKGRLVIITFHSLEDRIVKHTFKGFMEAGEGTVLTKKPIRATEEETKENTRSRSAKLRIFEKA